MEAGKRKVSEREIKISAHPKRPRHISKKLYDQQRYNKSRIHIGAAFERWRQLKIDKGLKTNAELANFLLDR